MARGHRRKCCFDIAGAADFEKSTCRPIDCAAACTSLRSASVSGVPGLTSMAILVAFGTNWRNNSNRFGPKVAVIKTTPVMLPPGRLMLVTRPSLNGIAAGCEHDWDGRGRGLEPQCCKRVRYDHGWSSRNHFGREFRRGDQIGFRPIGIRWRRFDPRRSLLPSSPDETSCRFLALVV